MSIPRDSFLQRITKYCADAERSTFDVFSKLISWEIPMDECEIIIRKLKSEKFLDDQRFADSYVREKWNLDKWGRVKIAHALENKNLDEQIILTALDKIDPEDYLNGMNDVLLKKHREIKSDQSREKARQIMMFAQSRGFEEDLILEWIEKELGSFNE